MGEHRRGAHRSQLAGSFSRPPSQKRKTITFYYDGALGIETGRRPQISDREQTRREVGGPGARRAPIPSCRIVLPVPKSRCQSQNVVVFSHTLRRLWHPRDSVTRRRTTCDQRSPQLFVVSRSGQSPGHGHLIVRIRVQHCVSTTRARTTRRG